MIINYSPIETVDCDKAEYLSNVWINRQQETEVISTKSLLWLGISNSNKDKWIDESLFLFSPSTINKGDNISHRDLNLLDQIL